MKHITCIYGEKRRPKIAAVRPECLNKFELEALDIDEWSSPNSCGLNYAPLPAQPGIYAFVRCEMGIEIMTHEVVYIGMSGSLDQRCGRHPLLAKLERQFRYVQTYFKPFPTEELRIIERAYIKAYVPAFNVIHCWAGVH